MTTPEFGQKHAVDTATTPPTPVSDAVTFAPIVLLAVKVGTVPFAASLRVVNDADIKALPALWPADYELDHVKGTDLTPLHTAHATQLEKQPDPTTLAPASPTVAYEPPQYVQGRWSRAMVYRDAGWRSALPGDADLTSVQPPEINPPASCRETIGGLTLSSDDFPVTFRHSGWARHRRLIREALVTIGTSERRLSAFDLCGSDPWVAVDESDPERLTILTNHCHSRWCVPCSRERANRIVMNMTAQLEQGTVRFLTLTMKHSATPLAEQITRIYHCFRRLRRATFWQCNVTGGCAVLEIKHSQRDNLWHVHLHCLLQGNWVEHRDIKAEWWRITGDADIVDIREVTDGPSGARHIVKYITKPIANTIINKPDCLNEMITACERRRLVLTWGTWRGAALSKPLDNTVWKSVCKLSDLYERYDVGNLDAILTVLALEKCVPEARALSGRGPPSENP